MKKDNNKLILNIFIIIIILLECIYSKLINETNNAEILYYVMIIFNIFIVGCILLLNKNDYNRKLNKIILSSFAFRSIMLIICTLIKFNVFNGNDTELFYSSAIGAINYTHHYTLFLRELIALIGHNRIVLEYFNVIMSLLSMIFFKKCLLMINENNKKRILFALSIFAFAPTNILLSIALLRETTMILLNILSLYSFIKWYKGSNQSYFLLSLLLIFLSSWFHSGMLLAVIGYSVFYVIYSRGLKKITFHRNTFISLLLIVIIIAVLYRIFGSSVTNYFEKIKSLDDLTVQRNVGNTDYLTFINNTKSHLMIFLYTPIKIVYFYISPMIWDCKTSGTLFVFCFSSVIYIYLLMKLLKNKSINKSLTIGIIIVLFFLSVTYAWGTSNAGTALRHREKLLPYLILLYSISEKQKRKNKN